MVKGSIELLQYTACACWNVTRQGRGIIKNFKTPILNSILLISVTDTALWINFEPPGPIRRSVTELR